MLLSAGMFPAVCICIMACIEKNRLMRSDQKPHKSDKIEMMEMMKVC